MSHPMFTLLTASLLAAAMAMVESRAPRERLYAGIRMLAGCLLTVAGGSWVMRLLHG